MIRIRLVALLALPALFGCAAGQASRLGDDGAGAKPNRRAAIRSVLPQNVRVVVTNGAEPVRSASAVVVANRLAAEGEVSYVLTNAHVVVKRQGESPRFQVLVEQPNGETAQYVAKVVAQGQVPEADLAVLSVQGVALEPAVLADDDDLTVGDDVFVVAAPYGRSLSVSGGMVSQVEYEKGSVRPSMIKTDAAIGYGASGGGLFSSDSGKLIGIVEGYRTAKVTIPVAQETYSFDVPMPGETFAAPAAKIRKFLAAGGLGDLLDAAGSSEARRMAATE